MVSSSLATPVVVNPIDVSVGPDPDSDMVAYERNTKVLLDEYANHPSNYSHILKLLEVTHLIRREKIQTSQLSIAQLQKENPYFQNGIWVCIQIRMSVPDSHCLMYHALLAVYNSMTYCQLQQSITMLGLITWINSY